MATVDYDALSTNPKVQEFLNILASAEGTAGKGDNGYNVGFGGSTFDQYGAHPNVSRSFRQTDGKTNSTTAAGRYQFLKSTWNDVAKKVGATDFSPANQDKGAIELIRQNGALDNVLTGDFNGAINKLGNIWASLPSSPYAQPKKTMASLLGSGSGDMMPAKVVMRGGQQMLALPTDANENSLMAAFDMAGHDDKTQSALTNALAQVTTARNQLVNAAPLFDDYPNDLDDQLLDLIDRA